MQGFSQRCCLLAMLLVAPCAWAVNLRLAGDQWPPYLDAAAPGGGIAVRIVTAALARAGYTTTFDRVPWARAIQGLGEGRYDVLMTVWYSEDRTLIGQHSAGYLRNRILLWRKRGSGIEFSHDLASLRDYPIAVSRGYAYSPAFTNDQSLQKVQVRNFTSAVNMLAAGRVNLAVEEERVGRFLLAQMPPAAKEEVEPLPVPLAETDLRILVSLKTPDHEQIVAAFDRAIAAMKADGTFKALLTDDMAHR